MRKKKSLVALGIGTSILFLLPAIAGATPAGTVDYVDVSNDVILQAQGRDIQGDITVGQTVKFGAKLVGGRQMTLDNLVFARRDAANTNLDFGHQTNYALGTNQQVYEASTTFAAAGTYTVWVAYNRGGTWTDLLPKQTITVVDSAPPPPPPGDGSEQPLGAGTGWNRTFTDEFSGTAVDTTKWQYQSSAESDWSTTPFGTGNPGNQQLEFDQPQNCSVSNGTLKQLAKPDNITSQSGQHYNWSSCLITSTGTNGWASRYGFIEIRAQLPGPKGFWPAFWTWQAPGVSNWNETDVYEFYSDNHTKLYLSQHAGAGGSTVYTPPFDPTTGFHVYGADINSSNTKFYIDGQLVYTAPGVSQEISNIVVDNFVYSVIPPDAGTSATHEVDYVRAWEKGATVAGPHPDIPQAAGRPMPSTLYGVTTDNGYNTTRLKNAANQFSRAPITRVVWDEFVAAADYAPTNTELRKESYIMGELLDSAYVNQYTAAQYAARTTEYLDQFGGNVDLYEVGNEVNGEWLGTTSSVVTKIYDAYQKVEARGLRTAITLYYNIGCEPDAAHNMFTWAQNNIPADMKAGLDYVFVSYYEQDCAGVRYDAAHWTTEFGKLHTMFPNSKLGFGEFGWTAASQSLSYRQQGVRDYYGMNITTPGFVGGGFYWYYHQQATPWINTSGVVNPMWQTLDEEFRTY